MMDKRCRRTVRAGSAEGAVIARLREKPWQSQGTEYTNQPVFPAIKPRQPFGLPRNDNRCFAASFRIALPSGTQICAPYG